MTAQALLFDVARQIRDEVIAAMEEKSELSSILRDFKRRAPFLRHIVDTHVDIIRPKLEQNVRSGLAPTTV
jgi:hypothetical protein